MKDRERIGEAGNTYRLPALRKRCVLCAAAVKRKRSRFGKMEKTLKALCDNLADLAVSAVNLWSKKVRRRKSLRNLCGLGDLCGEVNCLQYQQVALKEPQLIPLILPSHAQR